ncbi:hypothetical protein KCP73_04085 [Salmonella enterica subsp. enterica]|nr:hypothetical protein KCP73_04085 [Salmonella enterica subsp. enterica]
MWRPDKALRHPAVNIAPCLMARCNIRPQPLTATKISFWHGAYNQGCTLYRRNQVAPQHSIGSTIIVQTAIFASERCGALRKNKQYRSKIFATSHTKC